MLASHRPRMSLVVLSLLLSLPACSKPSTDDSPYAQLFIRGSICRGWVIDKDLGEALLFQRGADFDMTGFLVGPSFAGFVAPSCQLEATTCEEYLACVGIDTSTTCDPGEDDACDGSNVVGCDDAGWAKSLSCPDDPVGNDICADPGGERQEAQCFTDVCDSFDDRCEGDVLVDCGFGFAKRRDCGAHGGVCAVDSNGQGECVGRREPCSEDRCEGDTAILCRPGLGTTRVDCARAMPNGTCDVSLSGPLPCRVAPDVAACSPSRRSDECVGDIARVCVAGAQIDLDCSSFLDGTCEATNSVRCVSPHWTLPPPPPDF